MGSLQYTQVNHFEERCVCLAVSKWYIVKLPLRYVQLQQQNDDQGLYNRESCIWSESEDYLLLCLVNLTTDYLSDVLLMNCLFEWCTLLSLCALLAASKLPNFKKLEL